MYIMIGQLSKEIALIATIGILYTSALKCNAFSQSAPWMRGGAGIGGFGGNTNTPTSSTSYGSSITPTPEQREEVVRRYFDGVTKKNREQIQSCFADEACITDICSINASKRSVRSDLLAERCMEFLAAHPDCRVDFHYPPTCSRNNNWVFAHWYETGTWTGDSQGIKATGNPMAVEGQTRFYVNDELKITEFVVTRTFTEWEKMLQNQNKAPVNVMPQEEQYQHQQQLQQQPPQLPPQLPPVPQKHQQLQQLPPQAPLRVQSQQSDSTRPLRPLVGTRPKPGNKTNKQALGWSTPGVKPGAGRTRSSPNNGNRRAGGIRTQNQALDDTDGNKLGYTSRGKKERVREKGAGLTWSK